MSASLPAQPAITPLMLVAPRCETAVEGRSPASSAGGTVKESEVEAVPASLKVPVKWDRTARGRPGQPRPNAEKMPSPEAASGATPSS